MRQVVKKGVSVILIITLCVSVMSAAALAASNSLDNFTDKRTYTEGYFSDIGGQWFEGSVARAYSLGMIDGKDNNLYDPTGYVTLAEAIKLAACMHSIYTTGEVNFQQGSPWYQVYVDYCLTKGILSSGYTDYTVPATRTQFAKIFASALPSSALPAINTIDDNAIPDVKTGDDSASSIYKLYRAGILIGSDNKGTFNPKSQIMRSEMATIVTRMADPNLREEVTLTAAQDGILNAEQISAKCSSAVFYIEIYDRSGYAISSGSGVFISSDGKAITNHHVIEDAYSAKIQTTNGGIYTVSGWYDANENTDLALIQVDGVGFDYLEFGSTTSLSAGQNIYAIGSPLGLDNTISQGIISNPNRTVNGLGYIQISAPISHGSSGGALINDRGKLIGITSAYFENGQNLNLAVPVSYANQLSFSKLNSFPLYSPDYSGASLTFNNTLNLSYGGYGTVSITADTGNFYGEYLVRYDGINENIATVYWGDWNGNSIDLYVDAVGTGSTEVEISLLAGDTYDVLYSATLYINVTGNYYSSYYSGYYPTPDFTSVTGIPCYAVDDGYYYYRAIDFVDIETALKSYDTMLSANGFEYWKSSSTSDGSTILYYCNHTYDIYVLTVVGTYYGVPCYIVCPYYGWEA